MSKDESFGAVAYRFRYEREWGNPTMCKEYEGILEELLSKAEIDFRI